jgi:hypothetical protein
LFGEGFIAQVIVIGKTAFHAEIPEDARLIVCLWMILMPYISSLRLQFPGEQLIDLRSQPHSNA